MAARPGGAGFCEPFSSTPSAAVTATADEAGFDDALERIAAAKPVRGRSRMSSYILPILLLLCSNVFMTFAWYGQLKFPGASLWVVIPVSWGIAFFEYCLAVPANRIGYSVYSAAQLKTIQEIITVSVFAVFAITYLGESLRWNHIAAFGCLVLAAFFAFNRWT
jgi:uncharacterized protein (DUF486 family)